jgi:hypothetical protein
VKFDKLVCTKAPTTEPTILPHILEAKAIRSLNVGKTEGVTGSEEEIFSPDDTEEEEEKEVDVEQAAREGAGGGADSSVAGTLCGGVSLSLFLVFLFVHTDVNS